MARQSKYKRKGEPPNLHTLRITARERAILEFIHRHRLVTSAQIARVFWLGRAKGQMLANRALRKLYDLHLIERFFPPVEQGSSLQHVTLSKLGAKVLGVRFQGYTHLPANYRHTILANEFRIAAREYGWSWGVTEHNLGPVRADIYYPERNTAVEIDMGTEGLAALKAKTKRYNRANIQEIIMITGGKKERLQVFLEPLHVPKKAGTQVENIHSLLKRLR